jgi:hypothetical protein
MLDTGYWILDTGCWILDAGYWAVSVGGGRSPIHKLTSSSNEKEILADSRRFSRRFAQNSF